MNNTLKGNIGETLAAEYLSRRGYKIVATNWRYYHLEIDIIAQKDNLMIFAEVKLRQNQGAQSARDAVSRTKEQRLINAAEAWIMANQFDGESRFDLLAVTQHGKTYSIEHIENAFNPSF